MDQSIVHDLLKMEPKVCAFATATKTAHPHVAFMAFALLDGSHLLMNTDIHSRKVQNIKENSHVAVTIGWDGTKVNYQIEGEASIIIKEDIAHKTYKDVFYKQNPHLGVFKDIPNHIFIRILPTWIRINDYTVKPTLVREVSI